MPPALTCRPRPTRRRLLRMMLGGLGAAAVPNAGGADPPADAPLELGIFPFLPTLEIGRQFGPLATALADSLERPISLRTKAGFPAFRLALHEARFDIALLHPFLYSDVVHFQDYRPLARLRDDLVGVVVVPKSRMVTGYGDLRGEKLAVPPALSAVAQLVELELRRAELDGPDGVRLVHHRTKTACLHAVVTGQAAACVVPEFLLDQFAAASPIALEGKFRTASIPGILFVGHARLGTATLERLQDTFVGWNHSADGRRLLAGLGWSGLVAVGPDDYDTAALSPAAE